MTQVVWRGILIEYTRLADTPATYECPPERGKVSSWHVEGVADTEKLLEHLDDEVREWHIAHPRWLERMTPGWLEEEMKRMGWDKHFLEEIYEQRH